MDRSPTLVSNGPSHLVGIAGPASSSSYVAGGAVPAGRAWNRHAGRRDAIALGVALRQHGAP